MRKKGKRLLGLLLACAVTVGAALAMPMPAGAVNIQKGTPDVMVGMEVVFAGHTWVVVAEKGNTTFGTDGNSVTLLLKQGDGGFSDDMSRFTNGTNIYPGGELNLEMQGIYTAIGTGSSLEQGLIVPRLLDEVAVNESGEYETMDTVEYVWPLSETEYAAIGGAQAYDNDWWLRSPAFGVRGPAALYVTSNGGLSHSVNGTMALVRPAFNLDLASPLILFTSDASGASAKSSAAPNNILSPAGATGSAIKFTLEDSNLRVDSATVASVSGNTVTFGYTITASSSYNRLSAIVTDSTGETVKYYGNLADTSAASGSASVTVPGGLAATDQLLVFVEQVNPDSANMSDFASTPVQLTRAAPTGLAGAAPTAFGGADGKITGTTTEMEYSADNGGSWTPCTATETTNLSAGSYQVRYTSKVNGIQAIESATADVTVGAGVSIPTVANVTAPDAVDEGQALALTAPAVTENGATVTAQGWEISENGSTWAAFNPATPMTAAHHSRQLRYAATNSKGTGYSNTVSIAVNNAPTQANAANNSITPPSGTITAGKDFTFSATGDRQSVAAGEVTGDTRYRPANWSVNPSGSFPIGGPYTATTRIDSAGSHTLTVTYQLQRWSGSAWEDVAGQTDTKSVTLTVQAAGSSSTSTPTTSEKTPGSSPQTGDTSSLGLWVALAVLALAMLAGCLAWYKRRKKA